MSKNKYLSLFLILFITFIASAIGGFTTSSFKEPWYSQIILPSFNPPSWVFGPVWTTLYIMMSVAIWKIWINSFNLNILKLYFIHLFFNALFLPKNRLFSKSIASSSEEKTHDLLPFVCKRILFPLKVLTVLIPGYR